MMMLVLLVMLARSAQDVAPPVPAATSRPPDVFYVPTPQAVVDAMLKTKVTFLTQDLFESDISNATVVTLYLLPSLNEQLMPKLQKDLKPGTRVISRAFDMGSAWPPDERGEAEGKSYYLWIIK